MSIKLQIEHDFEFLSLKEATQARLSLHLSKCHIVRNRTFILFVFPKIQFPFNSHEKAHCNQICFYKLCRFLYSRSFLFF